MSNKKVEQYKKEKYNRKKIMKINAWKKAGMVAAFILIVAGLCTLIGFQVYDDNKEKFIDDVDVSSLYSGAIDVQTASTATPEPTATAENKTEGTAKAEKTAAATDAGKTAKATDAGNKAESTPTSEE